MKQETLIQILSLIFLVTLTIFYNPLESNFEGKIIFTVLITILLFIFVVFDVYKLIENNKTQIKIFNDKLNLLERIKNLESLNKI